MPDLLSGLLLSLPPLLTGAFSYAIIAAVFVIIGYAVFKLIEKRYKASWIIKAFAVTCIISIAVILFLYYYPSVIASSQYSLGAIPEEVAPTFAEEATEAILIFLRNILIALALAVILMPLELIGLAINDSILGRLGSPGKGAKGKGTKDRGAKTQKTPHILIAAAIAIYLSTLIAAIILLLFPGILPGILYMIYFA